MPKDGYRPEAAKRELTRFMSAVTYISDAVPGCANVEHVLAPGNRPKCLTDNLCSEVNDRANHLGTP